MDIDITKESVYILLLLFSLETSLDLASFIFYPSIFPEYINLEAEIFLSIILIFSIISLHLINKDNLYGYIISFVLSILILYSGFTLYQNNIIDIAVRNVASNYGIFPNPLILFWGIFLFSLSLRKIIKKLKLL
ncbi:MAG: hypothetical protein ACP5GJ_03620 [Nanopusillaceae archaeon]|jgi:hypothetical protein